MAWRTFLAVDALGGTLWTLYAAALGYFGGDAFRRSLWKPLVIALAVGAAFAIAVEAWQRITAHRQRRHPAPRRSSTGRPLPRS
jgi:membrane protein DedA with SNARE-associated domain